MKTTPTEQAALLTSEDEQVRGMFNHHDKTSIKRTVLYHMLSMQGRDPSRAVAKDVYTALAYTMRDFLIKKWISTQRNYYSS
ncbi:MAG TPA: hypothetical protein ENN06_05685, partial [Desulfobacteraceae bacterium]|nr:hypothetical protein [Desulfobacteraceae bacterium]